MMRDVAEDDAPPAPFSFEAVRAPTAIVAAIITFLFASASLELAGRVSGMTPLWLANVCVLAPLIRFPRIDRFWTLSGALVGLLLANVSNGMPLATSGALAVLNVIEIVAGLKLFSRFGERTLPLYAPRNLAAFLAGPGIFGPLIVAMGAAGLLSVTQGSAFASVALHWFAADALGMIVLGPLILVGVCADCVSLFGSTRRREILAVILAVGLVTFAVFQQERYPAIFLILPVITLAVFRLRFIGAAASVVTVALVATYLTMMGRGPIASSLSDMGERLLFLQLFLAVVVVAKFPVAAILVDREAMTSSLRDAERLFRRLAETSPLALFRTDRDGVITYANGKCGQIFGSRVGEPWQSLVVPEQHAVAAAAWHAAGAGGTSVAGDFDLIRRGGDAGWVTLALNPEIDETGQIIAWTGAVTDIDERRRTETRMVDSERHYRLLADNSNDMIVRIGLDGVRRFVSPASRVILGFDPEEMTGETPIAAIHVEDRARVEQVCRSLLEGAVDPICSYRQRKRDGTYAWLEATYRLIRNDDGTPEEFVASVRDIGRRRAAELDKNAVSASLHESNRLLNMAEGLAGVGHWRLDAVNQDVFWSDEVFRIHGREIGDIPLLAEAIDVYHVEDRPMVQRYVNAALTEGASWTFRARLIRPDGQTRHVQSSGQAEHAPDGTIVGVVGVFRDITEEVEAAVALVAARDEATASAEAKSAFLATMSHEIRTPMTGVLGMIELLRSDLPIEDRERFFDNLEQSANLLMTVLDDVLDFSKIESRNLVLEHFDFDLGELVRNTMDLFHHAASKKGLIFSMSAPVGRDLQVRGDPVRVQQVMANLISNAIKFTNSGKVELRLQVEPSGRRRRIRLEVADTGVGIAPDAIDQLFQPFIQADASTTRRFGGTGLGLAISKRLVEAMGGKIGVESDLGRGTCFGVEVTLDAGRAVVAPKSRQEAAPTRRLSILLAEDNQINRILVEALVRKDGHRITSVENGRLALDLASTTSFDAILMDMQMPEMDGLAATRAIREGGGPCADVPIIALTADASAERRRFYDNAGLTEFLTKPINSDLLSERLRLIADGEMPAPAAPPTLTDGEELLDEEKLSSLEQAIGHAGTSQLVDMLAVELATRPGIILKMIELNQHEAVMAEVHALKGATLNIGATHVGNVARRIEEACDEKAPLDELGRYLMIAARATRVAIDERHKRRRA